MRCFITLIGVTLGLFVAGCSSVSVTADFDPATDFSTFKTYQWMPSKGEDILTKNAIIGKRVTGTVDKVLASKGYRVAATNAPDFYITAHAGVKDKMNVSDYGYAYGGWWGPYGPYGRNVDVQYYQEATLFIDIVQRHGENLELVWRGAGTDVVKDRDPDEAQRYVDAAVEKILAQFPPER
jgi:hypothetical protein